mgnify:CR=1 FL=1
MAQLEQTPEVEGTDAAPVALERKGRAWLWILVGSLPFTLPLALWLAERGHDVTFTEPAERSISSNSLSMGAALAALARSRTRSPHDEVRAAQPFAVVRRHVRRDPGKVFWILAAARGLRSCASACGCRGLRSPDWNCSRTMPTSTR